jgi:hypothetical protein
MPFIKDGVAYITLQPQPRQARWKALIDIEDIDRVSATKWYGQRSGRTIYVRATSTKMLPVHHASLHMFIMRAEPGQRVDHINGNGLDNRKANLRFATVQQNNWNTLKTNSRHVTSRFKGVILTSSGKWAAHITKDADFQALGLFDSEADAARAYDEAAIRLFGEFAKTNAAMGLFDSEAPVRDLNGWDGRVPVGAEFVRTAPDLEPWQRLDAPNPGREDMAKVVGFARHRRHRTILYVLDTGKTVRPNDYQGPKVPDSLLNQFAQELKDRERLKREAREMRQGQVA